MLDAPRVYRPVSALADYTEIIGHWHAHVGYRSRALPRGAITLIIDVGRRQQLDFYAADGRTRLSVPPAFLTGSHTVSYVSEMAADEPAMAVHFLPGGAFPFLGMPLSDLENACVGLDQVWGRAGMELHERLIDAPTMAARFSTLENFLLSQPWSSARRHPGVAAALAAIEDNPSIRMADIRDLVGMSTKRLIALFRAEVGLSPKAYARIRRFQAALRLLSGGRARRASRGRCRLFRPSPLRPGIPVFRRHDADAVCRTTDSVAQPRPRRGAGAAQISKTAGGRTLMMGRWTTPNTR